MAWFDEINSQTNPIRSTQREKKKEQWQPNHFSFSLFRFYLSNDEIHRRREKKMAVTVRKTTTKRNPKW